MLKGFYAAFDMSTTPPKFGFAPSTTSTKLGLVKGPLPVNELSPFMPIWAMVVLSFAGAIGFTTFIILTVTLITDCCNDAAKKAEEEEYGDEYYAEEDYGEEKIRRKIKGKARNTETKITMLEPSSDAGEEQIYVFDLNS